VLRVARTVADLAGVEAVLPEHVAAGVRYRGYTLNRVSGG